MKKIVVIGFPHCGTTILRKLIGNSSEVFDVQIESMNIPDIKILEKNCVIKFTTTDLDAVLSKYNDFKIVSIIKNPFDVLGSINRRFINGGDENHTISDWDKYANSFIKYMNNPIDNMYTVKYEDLFDESYNEIKNIYDFLGLEYSEDIINSNREIYISPTCKQIPKEEPEGCTNGVQHGEYRTWQTNQPFKNKTGDSRKYLTVEQEEQIRSLESVKKLNYL
jgi:hypothetical protein